MSQETAAVEIEGLRHRYGAVTVLALEDWRVPKGANCLVQGPSGSGKSTLLHILAGLTLPGEGRVRVDGTDVPALQDAARDRFRARSIGLVPQRLHLIGAISVADNLRLACRLAGLPAEDEHIQTLLEQLSVGELSLRKPDALSQGQAQRVAVARALVNAPAVLLADEPTAALDDQNAQTVIDLLQEAAAASKATLVVASHDRRLDARFDQRLELGQAPAGREGS